MAELLSPITYEWADELSRELEGYHPDTELFHGATAVSSLAAVAQAPKRFEQPTIVFNGADYRARLNNEAAQHVLF